MNKSLITLSAVVAALFASQAVLAQDAPKARADVKAETKAAVKAGKTVEGEGSPAAGAKTASTKADRAEVKADTKAAVKAGKTVEGEGAPAAGAKTASTKADRAEVKAETKAAVKAGKTVEGEAPMKK